MRQQGNIICKIFETTYVRCIFPLCLHHIYICHLLKKPSWFLWMKAGIWYCSILLRIAKDSALALGSVGNQEGSVLAGGCWSPFVILGYWVDWVELLCFSLWILTESRFRDLTVQCLLGPQGGSELPKHDKNWNFSFSFYFGLNLQEPKHIQK